MHTWEYKQPRQQEFISSLVKRSSWNSSIQTPSKEKIFQKNYPKLVKNSFSNFFPKNSFHEKKKLLSLTPTFFENWCRATITFIRSYTHHYLGKIHIFERSYFSSFFRFERKKRELERGGGRQNYRERSSTQTHKNRHPTIPNTLHTSIGRCSALTHRKLVINPETIHKSENNGLIEQIKQTTWAYPAFKKQNR